MNKKKICIITHHPFWSELLGCGMVMRARYQILKKLCDEVLVLYITTTNEKSPLPGGTLRLRQKINLKDILNIKSFLKQRNISTCYFSYDHFGFLTEYTDCNNIVEIYDLMHLREMQFKKFGYEATYSKNKKDELDSLKRYDTVICLNIDEVKYLHENNIDQAIYLPPNTNLNKIELNSNKNNFGFISSVAKPNIDGFKCLNKSLIQSKDFVIAGSICLNKDIINDLGDKANIIGVIKNPISFYEKINLALSPIRFGGGLKTKVFEALSFCKPVLATKHSVEGFPSNIEEVITVDNDVKSWNYETVMSASKIKPSKIKEYFLSNFGEKKCSDIIKKIL